MSRQNRNSGRDRKSEEAKREASNNNGRYTRNNRESRNEQDRNDLTQINGLDRHRLNDLYERSSI